MWGWTVKKVQCSWGVGDNGCGFRSDKESPVCGKHLTAVVLRELSRSDVPSVVWRTS